MKRMFILFVLLLLILSIIGCQKKKTVVNDPSKITYETLGDAIKDNCVVFEDSKLTFGEDLWKTFIQKTNENEVAEVRIVRYYSLEAQEDHVSDELYKEMKQQYPLLFVLDLSYDGSLYHVFTKEDNKEYRYEYKYLNHYTGKAREGAAYNTYDHYILVNDKDVTYNELEWSLLSSNSKDHIDHYWVYSNYLD